jgi:hypothetical protein
MNMRRHHVNAPQPLQHADLDSIIIILRAAFEYFNQDIVLSFHPFLIQHGKQYSQVTILSGRNNIIDKLFHHVLKTHFSFISVTSKLTSPCSPSS